MEVERKMEGVKDEGKGKEREGKMEREGRERERKMEGEGRRGRERLCERRRKGESGEGRVGEWACGRDGGRGSEEVVRENGM